jgi:starch synthase
MQKRNGYVFYQTDHAAIESAMDRAIGLYYSYPDEFEKLVLQGMEYDYSWNDPGSYYLGIFDFIRHH